MTCWACSIQTSIIEPNFDEKGDGFSSSVTDLGSLEFGAETSHAFEADFQFFSFTFDAVRSAEVGIEVTQRGSSRGLDTTLFVYRMAVGQEPRRIAFDDDDGFGALSKLAALRLFTDDRYAVVVGTKNGRGRFRLTVLPLGRMRASSR